MAFTEKVTHGLITCLVSFPSKRGHWGHSSWWRQDRSGTFNLNVLFHFYIKKKELFLPTVIYLANFVDCQT